MTDGARQLIPGVQVLRTYQRAWLGNDIAAGLVWPPRMVTLDVPQSLFWPQMKSP